MELSDILPVEKWIELEKDIYGRSGLASNVFDTNGIRITGFKVWVNRLCPAIKADDRGQSFICAVAHMNLASMAKQKKCPVIGECDAGLVKVVVPVFVKGQFLGAVGACGLLPGGGEVDSFMVNRTIQMEEDRITALTDDIKEMSYEQVEALAGYIKERIEKIVGDFEKDTYGQDRR